MSKNPVQVCVKIRPKDAGEASLWHVKNNCIQLTDSTAEPYQFDFIFDENVNNAGIFQKMARGIIESCVQGFNGTIFAYGQTSSGKTYTMMGDDENPGVMILAAQEIFNQIRQLSDRQFLLRVGYIELYNEKIYDLLNKRNQDLKIFETSTGVASVSCEEKIITCEEELLHFLYAGNKERTVRETNMNEHSSRSHAIFRIIIESSRTDGNEGDAVNQSVLNLVDLAGSERANQTGASGARLKEGGHINKSLLFLSNVIKQLAENEDHTYISYRSSKLTRILQASLGGNAMTSIICTIKPTIVEETLSTLNFAMRAKKIKNKPQLNEIISETTVMKRLEKEIKGLRNQLAEERRRNESKCRVYELEDRIKLDTLKIITGDSVKSEKTGNRRRTWCPMSSTGTLKANTIVPPMSVRPIPVSIPHERSGDPEFKEKQYVYSEDQNPNKLLTNNISCHKTVPKTTENWNENTVHNFQENEYKKDWLNQDLEMQEYLLLETQFGVQPNSCSSLVQKLEAVTLRNETLEQKMLEYLAMQMEFDVTKRELNDALKTCEEMKLEKLSLEEMLTMYEKKSAKDEREILHLKQDLEEIRCENRKLIDVNMLLEQHKNISKLREAELLAAIVGANSKPTTLKESVTSNSEQIALYQDVVSRKSIDVLERELKNARMRIEKLQEENVILSDQLMGMPQENVTTTKVNYNLEDAKEKEALVISQTFRESPQIVFELPKLFHDIELQRGAGMLSLLFSKDIQGRLKYTLPKNLSVEHYQEFGEICGWPDERSPQSSILQFPFFTSQNTFSEKSELEVALPYIITQRFQTEIQERYSLLSAMESTIKELRLYVYSIQCALLEDNIIEHENSDKCSLQTDCFSECELNAPLNEATNVSARCESNICGSDTNNRSRTQSESDSASVNSEETIATNVMDAYESKETEASPSTERGREKRMSDSTVNVLDRIPLIKDYWRIRTYYSKKIIKDSEKELSQIAFLLNDLRKKSIKMKKLHDFCKQNVNILEWEFRSPKTEEIMSSPVQLDINYSHNMHKSPDKCSRLISMREELTQIDLIPPKLEHQSDSQDMTCNTEVKDVFENCANLEDPTAIGVSNRAPKFLGKPSVDAKISKSTEISITDKLIGKQERSSLIETENRRSQRRSMHDLHRESVRCSLNTQATLHKSSLTECNYILLEEQLQALHRDLFISESRVAALNMELKHHPLKAENNQLKKRLLEDQEKYRNELNIAKLKCQNLQREVEVLHSNVKPIQRNMCEVGVQTASTIEDILRKLQMKYSDSVKINRNRYRIIMELQKKVDQKENVLPDCSNDRRFALTSKEREDLRSELIEVKEKYQHAKVLISILRRDIENLKVPNNGEAIYTNNSL